MQTDTSATTATCGHIATMTIRNSALRALLVIATLAAAVMLATPDAANAASASYGDSARDPEDVDGRLDLVFVSAVARDHRVILKVRTAETWGCRYLQSRSRTGSQRSASLRWHIDTDSDPYTEHTAFANCRDGRWSVTFAEAGRTFRATRPDLYTFRVVLPRHRFGLDRLGLEIDAITRVDQVDAGSVLFDEEDVARTLRPYAL